MEQRVPKLDTPVESHPSKTEGWGTRFRRAVLGAFAELLGVSYTLPISNFKEEVGL